MLAGRAARASVPTLCSKRWTSVGLRPRSCCVGAGWCHQSQGAWCWLPLAAMVPCMGSLHCYHPWSTSCCLTLHLSQRSRSCCRGVFAAAGSEVEPALCCVPTAWWHTAAPPGVWSQGRSCQSQLCVPAGTWCVHTHLLCPLWCLRPFVKGVGCSSTLGVWPASAGQLQGSRTDLRLPVAVGTSVPAATGRRRAATPRRKSRCCWMNRLSTMWV